MSLRGTLPEVPFIASAKYGWFMSKFEWKFLAMPTNQSVDKKETIPVQMSESTNVATERTNLPTKIVRITAKTDVNARAMLKSQVSHEILATAELRELKENKEETTTDSKLEKTHTAIQKKEPLSELKENIDLTATTTLKLEKSNTSLQKNELKESTGSQGEILKNAKVSPFEPSTIEDFVESNEKISQFVNENATEVAPTLTNSRLVFALSNRFYFFCVPQI